MLRPRMHGPCQPWYNVQKKNTDGGHRAARAGAQGEVAVFECEQRARASPKQHTLFCSCCFATTTRSSSFIERKRIDTSYDIVKLA